MSQQIREPSTPLIQRRLRRKDRASSASFVKSYQSDDPAKGVVGGNAAGQGQVTRKPALRTGYAAGDGDEENPGEGVELRSIDAADHRARRSGSAAEQEWLP